MIEVKVPATSANMGPGFDCMGIALNLYNTIIFEEIDSGLIIDGDGLDVNIQNENNLIYTSMLKCFEKTNHELKGMKITINADVPVSRGLGSSATCIVAGVMGANKLSKVKLSLEEMIKLATDIEGHPDNIIPAMLGGCITSIYEEKVYYNRVRVENGLKYYALIPNFKLSTKKAREIIPKSLPFKDAVFNIGRISLMVTALGNGNFDLLKVATEDSLHQPYRGELINGYDSIIDASRKSGAYGSFLSGAGPTIMVMVDKSDSDIKMELEEHIKGLDDIWEIKELFMDKRGTIVRELR